MNEPSQSALAGRNAEAAQTRFALRLTAALSEQQNLTSHADIDARLQFAHDRALAVARQARSVAAATATAPAVVGMAGGAALLGNGGTPWWLRLGSLVPLAVLLAGLVVIDRHYTRSQIEAAAEVDAAILADDLPPEAYRDTGFVEFLKTARP
jgi:Protein of unknown function (DUF3619)